MPDLINKEFIGTVLSDKDNNHQGRYKVNISELQPHTKDTDGIWVKNHSCRNRISPSAVGVCGAYFPLQAGMAVIVKFFSNHMDSGYVDRVVSDAYPQTLPFEAIERDDFYLLLRTPIHNNIIAVYDSDTASKNIPKNSIHVYFNSTRTTVIIDENGINIKTDDNIDVTVAKNVKITANGTADIKVTGNTNITSAADVNIKSSGKTNIDAGGDANIKVGGNANMSGSVVNIKGGSVNIQGAPVSINGSAPDAAAAAAASDATAPSLITISDYSYFKKNSGR
jgi:uncharacterized protein involved in type VI secretion and phage assembly